MEARCASWRYFVRNGRANHFPRNPASSTHSTRDRGREFFAATQAISDELDVRTFSGKGVLAMLGAGQEVIINRNDLQAALAPLPAPRRRPRRYRIDAVALIRMAGDALAIEIAGTATLVSAKGTWKQIYACDAWALKRVITRLPAAPEIRFIGFSKRLMIAAYGFQAMLPAVDAPNIHARRAIFSRLFALDVTTLPLFRSDLFRQV